MDAPAHVGCLIEVRFIGVISAEQIEDGNKETNDRLLRIAIHSYDHEDIETIDDVSKTLLSQLEEFFVSYNKQRGKKFRITGTGGPKKSIKFLKDATRKQKVAKKKSAVTPAGSIGTSILRLARILPRSGRDGARRYAGRWLFPTRNIGPAM